MKKFILIITVVGLLLIGLSIYFILRTPSSDIGNYQLMDDTEVPVDKVPTDQLEEPEEPYVDPFPNDRDRDGLTDDEEEELGTSDVQYDTDGDGLSDVSEINRWNTDPLKRDTDGDGFADGWEVIKGYNPAGAGTL